MESSWLRNILAALVLLTACRTGRNYAGLDGPRYGGGPDGTRAPARDTLRIVTFNIEYSLRVDSAIALLREEPNLRSADVILLQEMTADATRRIADTFGMHFVYYPAIFNYRHKRDVGNAILARWPLADDAKFILPHRARIVGTNRGATAATVTIGETRVRIYSTHLGTVFNVSERSRTDQLRAILADAAKYPRAILGGDMNDAEVGRITTSAGFSWPTRVGPRTASVGRLDHIFLKGLHPPDSAATGTITEVRNSSDHRPVWVRAILR